jgi:hypothetical protein
MPEELRVLAYDRTVRFTGSGENPDAPAPAEPPGTDAGHSDPAETG